MGNWKEFIEQDERSHKHVQKPNKNIFCRRNKLGNNQYGYHVYEEGSNNCRLCGHLKDKVVDEAVIKRIKENNNEQ